MGASRATARAWLLPLVGWLPCGQTTSPASDGPPGRRRPRDRPRLECRWGAGLSWRFTRNAELFGGYRFMQFGRDSLSHGDRSTSSDTELTGHDVLYGISVRF